MFNKLKTAALSTPFISYAAKDLVWTCSLLLASVITPGLLAHTPGNQWITGTLVNAIIFIAVWRVGIVNALLIAAIPSSVALMRGLLPAPMATLIPFIIFSNVILVIAFAMLKKNPLIGIVAASIAKFLFLFFVSTLFMPKLVANLVIMLQWPQLATALAGGLILLGFIKGTVSELTPTKNC